MDGKIHIGDIMTKNFVHLSPDANLLMCAKLMVKKRVGSIVLRQGDDIQGIITEKDIIWALAKKRCENLGEVLAKEVATSKIVTIRPESDLDEALSKMIKKKVRRLPVVSNKKIVGYVTLKDILRFKPTLFESLEEFHHIKEETDKIKRSKSAMKGEFLEAPCEECGNFDILRKSDGRMLCESCADEI